MSPQDLIDAQKTLRFPRVSGDEPVSWSMLVLSCGFSPRERG